MSPPMFHQLVNSFYRNEDFFEKLIASLDPSCIDEWIVLIETFLACPSISAETKSFISSKCVELCSKNSYQLSNENTIAVQNDSHHSHDVSEFFLQSKLLYEITNNADFHRTLQKFHNSLDALKLNFTM